MSNLTKNEVETTTPPSKDNVGAKKRDHSAILYTNDASDHSNATSDDSSSKKVKTGDTGPRPTGYYHITTTYGRSSKPKSDGRAFESEAEANAAAKELWESMVLTLPGVDSQVCDSAFDGQFNAFCCYGHGSGCVSMFVTPMHADDMRKPMLKVELEKRGIMSDKLSVRQMRQKLGDALHPSRVAWRKESQEAARAAEAMAKSENHHCEVCNSHGTVPKKFLVFEMSGGEKFRYHEKCARKDNLILSSTNARKFLGPKLFGSVDQTPDLPVAYGGHSSYGQARFYRITDLNSVLRANGKATKSAPVKKTKKVARYSRYLV